MNTAIMKIRTVLGNISICTGRTAKEFVLEHPGELDIIKWVMFDERTFDAYREELNRWEAAEIVSSPEFYDINRTLRNGGI